MTSISDTAYYYNPNDNKFYPMDVSNQANIPADSVWNTPACPMPTFTNQTTADSTNPYTNYYQSMGYCGTSDPYVTGSFLGGTSSTVALATQQEVDNLTDTGKQIVDAQEQGILNTVIDNNNKVEMAKDPAVDEAASAIINNANGSRLSFKSLFSRSTSESEEAYNNLSAEQQEAVRERVQEETQKSVKENLQETQNKEGLGITGFLKSAFNIKPDVKHKSAEE